MDADVVRAVLLAAELRLLEVEANHDPTSAGSISGLQRAEQDLLLVRLAADTGARRGELAALRFEDLRERSLTITRAVSAGQLTVPKSGRSRTLTVGTSTAVLWQTLAGRRAERATHAGRGPLGSWLFASDPGHQHRLGAEVLGHRFAVVAATAGMSVTLHQLRHAVATLLVSQGQVLAAQQRLGHAGAATTLRVYCHALPGTDHAAADAIDAHLRPRKEPSPPQPQPWAGHGVTTNAPHSRTAHRQGPFWRDVTTARSTTENIPWEGQTTFRGAPGGSVTAARDGVPRNAGPTAH